MLGDYKQELGSFAKEVQSTYDAALAALFPHKPLLRRLVSAAKEVWLLSLRQAFSLPVRGVLFLVLGLWFGWWTYSGRVLVDPSSPGLNLFIATVQASFAAFVGLPLLFSGWRFVLPVFASHLKATDLTELRRAKATAYLVACESPLRPSVAFALNRNGAQKRSLPVAWDVGATAPMSLVLLLTGSKGRPLYLLNLSSGRFVGAASPLMLDPGIRTRLSEAWVETLRQRGLLQDCEALLLLATQAVAPPSAQVNGPRGVPSEPAIEEERLEKRSLRCPRCSHAFSVPPVPGASECPRCASAFTGFVGPDGFSVEWAAQQRPHSGRQEPASAILEAAELLGVSPNASAAELKRAWKKAASMYHPDKHQNLPEPVRKLAEEQMQRVNVAYDLLVASAKG